MNSQDRKALVLFSLTPESEAKNKSITRNSKANIGLLNLLLDRSLNTIKQAHQQSKFDIFISTDNSSSRRFAIALSQSGIDNFKFLEQDKNSFNDNFTGALETVQQKGYNKTIIIGNDTPDLTPELLIQTFDKLDETNFVIGPSTDGGMYLLGMNYFSSRIFNGIEWFSDKVTKYLIKNIRTNKLSVSFLQELTDLDNENILKRWINTCKSSCRDILQIVNFLFNSQPNFFRIQNHPLKHSSFLRLLWQKAPPVIFTC